MTKKSDNSNANTVKTVICAVLTVSLVVMVLGIVYMLNMSQSLVPFDLSTITAEKTEYSIDITRFILPEFIGITYDGERLGVSGSANILAEIYRELSGVISEVVRGDCLIERSATDWSILAESDISVYVRYHSELPDCVVGVFADASRGDETKRDTVSSYIYEMYIIPNTDGSGKIDIAVKSKSGEVKFYTGTTESILTGDSTEKMLDSYRADMYSFKMSNGQPVFTENIATRNILITGNTGALIQTEMTDEEKSSLMRFFALNPDKLLSSHVDEEGMDSYVDTHGALYIRESGVEYNSASDGGIGLGDFIGYSEEPSLAEYIKASISIITYFRSLNRNITGGDGEIYLDSVTSSEGKVTLEFMYAFNGIRICDMEPAFTAEFENGILRKMKLYSVSVRNLGERHILMLEDSFISVMENEGKHVARTSVVYRSDFQSESVSAEWQCVYN